jgi:hypothetical protein
MTNQPAPAPPGDDPQLERAEEVAADADRAGAAESPKPFKPRRCPAC